MSVDDVGLILHEVFIDKIAIRLLDVTDGNVFGFVGGRNDAVENFRGFIGTTVAIDGIELGG